MQDTQLVKQNVQITQWAELLHERKISNMTVDNFCVARGITKNQYYYWLRKVRKAAIEGCPTEFAEILPPQQMDEGTYQQSIPDFHTQMKLQIGRVCISVNEDTPSGLIRLGLEIARDAE